MRAEKTTRKEYKDPEELGWGITMISQQAIIGYIGEVRMSPTVLYEGICRVLRKRPPPTVILYYYGEPDAYLREKFGYPSLASN